MDGLSPSAALRGCFDACHWYLVGYTLKASQVVPTSEPMDMLISGISIARSSVSSPAVASIFAFAMKIVMPTVRISLATL